MKSNVRNRVDNIQKEQNVHSLDDIALKKDSNFECKNYRKYYILNTRLVQHINLSPNDAMLYTLPKNHRDEQTQKPLQWLMFMSPTCQCRDSFYPTMPPK